MNIRDSNEAFEGVSSCAILCIYQELTTVNDNALQTHIIIPILPPSFVLWTLPKCPFAPLCCLRFSHLLKQPRLNFATST